MRNFCICACVLCCLWSCGENKHQEGESLQEQRDTVRLNETHNKQVIASNGDSGGTYAFDNEVYSLGIGLILAPTKLKLYDDSLLQSEFLEYDMYHDKIPENLYSKFYKPDYGMMHFVCLDRTTTYYKVLINFSDIKYFPAEKDYVFSSWENYIMTSYGIRRLLDDIESTREQDLLEMPDDKAKVLQIPDGHELFCPIRIEGDWIKVKYDCFYNKEQNDYEGEPCYRYINECKTPLTGWLKWKETNRILIDIFLMP